MNARPLPAIDRPRRERGGRLGLLFALAVLLITAPAVAQPLVAGGITRHVLGDGVQLNCALPVPRTLRCGYRLVFGGEVDAARASLAGQPLPSPTLTRTSGAGGVLLLLVDTSDPARADTVAANVRHLRTLLDALPANLDVGLAAFDSTLRLLAEPGSPRSETAQAAAGLQAVGLTTEGYRSTLEAVRLLGAREAEHRTLLILSDGLFEDRAYFHRDVVDAAREAGVVIHALGYARSVALSVALQTLRRLAEETGGLYGTANPSRPLPSSFLDALLSGLEDTGQIGIDLGPGFAAAQRGGSAPVELRLTTANGVAVARIPVEVPAPPPPPPPEPVVIRVPVEVPAAPVAPAPRPAAAPPAVPSPAPAAPPPEPAWPSLPAWVLAVAALAVLLTALAAFTRYRRPRSGDARPAASPMTTLAYLETDDGSGTRHPVTSALFRIGRHGDNDLVLNDGSISRHHAQLQRHRDGSFSVRDLESLNGVLVNGERIQDAPLADGDLLEVGDVALRFRGDAERELPGEDTVIMRTAMPSRPLPGVDTRHTH